MNLRNAIQDYLYKNPISLSGYDRFGILKIEEINESLFFGRNYNRGPYIETQWYLRWWIKLFQMCSNHSIKKNAATLLPIIRQYVWQELSVCAIVKLRAALLPQIRNIYTCAQITHITSLPPNNNEVHPQMIERC